MGKPTKLSEERAARLKIAKLSEYMNHPFFPPHLKKEYEEKILALREKAWENQK